MDGDCTVVPREYRTDTESYCGPKIDVVSGLRVHAPAGLEVPLPTADDIIVAGAPQGPLSEGSAGADTNDLLREAQAAPAAPEVVTCRDMHVCAHPARYGQGYALDVEAVKQHAA
jgi:hypothetical protein